MASPSSPEYRAITKNIASISTAFSSSGILPWLAEKLFEADFISEQLCSDICSTLSVNNYTKSSNLMQCVMRRIKQNPSKYYTFIAILEEQPSLIDIVNSIQGITSIQLVCPVPIIFVHQAKPLTLSSRVFPLNTAGV